MIKTTNPAIINAFGKRVKELRKQRGLTMEKLAELADIEYRQLGRVERGEINTSISTAFVISKALGVTFSELMDIKEV